MTERLPEDLAGPDRRCGCGGGVLNEGLGLRLELAGSSGLGSAEELRVNMKDPPMGLRC